MAEAKYKNGKPEVGTGGGASVTSIILTGLLAFVAMLAMQIN